jgi:hypothetical protein
MSVVEPGVELERSGRRRLLKSALERSVVIAGRIVVVVELGIIVKTGCNCVNVGSSIRSARWFVSEVVVSVGHTMMS